MSRVTEAGVPLHGPSSPRLSRFRIHYIAARLLAAPAFPFFPPWLLARRLSYPVCGWDEAVTRSRFRQLYSREIDLANPTNFSEKLNWLKLFHRKPIHEVLADKIACQDFVRGRGYGDLLLERYGIWDKPEEVPLQDLPETFVLKAAHGWHMNWFQRRGEGLPLEKIGREMRRWVRTDHSVNDGEWQYRRIPRRIFAEPLLEFPQNKTVDYKIFCFGGRPRFVRALVDRHQRGGASAAHFDLDWRRLPFLRVNQRRIDHMPRPTQLDRMVEVASALSADEPFLRVDFYEIDGRAILGELTLYPEGGTFKIEPAEWDDRLGSWIELPRE